MDAMRPEMPGSLRCYNFPLTGDYVEYQAPRQFLSDVRKQECESLTIPK